MTTIEHPTRKRGAKTAAASAPAAPAHEHERDYSAFLSGVRSSFAALEGAMLFTTDAEGLNKLYLAALPEAERQLHDCHSCRRFIESYGGLVAITELGETIPAMWRPESVPDFYRDAVLDLSNRVKRARVTGAFLSKHPTWGTPETGPWTHLAVTPAAVYHERALTAGQAMAATRENYRTVATALSEITAPMLDQALRLLAADALARSERFVGPVTWLRALHDRPKGRAGENVLWRAVASAPEGYCHPRASVVGSLLEDIAAGLPFADLQARFNAKLGPLIYQRPQAAPAEGNIRAAEALVEKLSLAPALERRFARLDELQTLWLPRPAPEAPDAGGVFGHLTPKGLPGAVKTVALPAVTITWEKFARTVLPGAERLELAVPLHGRFIALTTAVHPDAPPLLKWDRDDARNPVAWYVYPGSSPAFQWGLCQGWAKVSAVAPFPNQWGAHPLPFLGEGAVLIINGAVDSRTDCGNALFPEHLREELHGARATIEAYSRTAVLSGREHASACGYDLRKAAADCHLRTWAAGAWSEYRIDRWD